MKLLRPITVKVDEATEADLERILADEKRTHPDHTITRGGIIRRLIRERARDVRRDDTQA